MQTPRTEWVLAWPGQIVIAGCQTFWTKMVEEALETKKLDDLLQVLIDQVSLTAYMHHSYLLDIPDAYVHIIWKLGNHFHFNGSQLAKMLKVDSLHVPAIKNLLARSSWWISFQLYF